MTKWKLRNAEQNGGKYLWVYTLVCLQFIFIFLTFSLEYSSTILMVFRKVYLENREPIRLNWIYNETKYKYCAHTHTNSPAKPFLTWFIFEWSSLNVQRWLHCVASFAESTVNCGCQIEAKQETNTQSIPLQALHKILPKKTHTLNDFFFFFVWGNWNVYECVFGFNMSHV